MEIATENGTIRSLETGILSVNCYLIRPAGKKILYIIDPGGSVPEILSELRSFPDISEYRILLTHAHFDHIGGAGGLTKALHLPSVFLHPDDRELYACSKDGMPPFPPVPDLPPNVWDEKMPEETGDFRILHTPGHSLGSVSYYFPAFKACFTGDTLFAGGIGRTDFPFSGTHRQLIDSIRNHLYTLPAETRIFPGHGPDSTISREISSNPFTI